MIDLHCHLLPGVDDGPESMEEALQLARIAVADGIEVAVLTPHIHPGRYGNTRSLLLAKVLSFQKRLVDENIQLTIHLGGEVRIGIESLDLILNNEAPYLGNVDGFRVMLLEFPHQTLPVGSQQFIEKLLSLKIRPLIAHPERNKAIMAQPEKIRSFVDSGCWLQLTAGSIVGAFGKPSQATARYLLENELIHVIATDAHNVAHRPPILSTGRQAAAEIVGQRMANQMVVDRPMRIIGKA